MPLEAAGLGATHLTAAPPTARLGLIAGCPLGRSFGATDLPRCDVSSSRLEKTACWALRAKAGRRLHVRLSALQGARVHGPTVVRGAQLPCLSPRGLAPGGAVGASSPGASGLQGGGAG